MFEFFKKFFKKKKIVDYKEDLDPQELLLEYLQSPLAISLFPLGSETAWNTLKELMLVMIGSASEDWKNKNINPSRRRSLLIWGYDMSSNKIPKSNKMDIITTKELNRMMPRLEIDKAFNPYVKLMNAKKYFFIVQFPCARVFKDANDRFYQYEREAIVFMEMVRASSKIKRTRSVLFVDVLEKEKHLLKPTTAEGMPPGKLIDVTGTFEKIKKL